MEPLFKNKTLLSEENYLDLVEFHQKKNNWKYWMYNFIFSCLFIFLIISHIVMHNYLYIFIFSFCFIIFLVYRFVYPYYKTSKELKSDKVQHNLENYYLFYEKYIKIKNKLGVSKIRYYKLYKVYENENYFYIYLNKTNAFILDKSGFLIGNVESFKKFMKGKVWLKFKED